MDTYHTFDLEDQLRPETTYRFRVQATNSIGSGEKSEEVEQKTDRQYTIPYAPTNLREVSQDANTVTINFVAPTNTGGPAIDNFIVYIDKVDEVTGELKTLDDVTSKETTIILNLDIQSTYNVQVAANNSVGAGATTDVIVVNT